MLVYLKRYKSLYDSSSSSVLIKNISGSFFNTTIGVRQGCLLSPVLFNILLEQMLNTLHKHTSTISIGGRNINNLRFADDIYLIAGSNNELQELKNRVVYSSKAYRMEISQEKSKTMLN